MVKKMKSRKPVYIIAELSANHGGSLEHASKTIRAAAEAGADAIKLQTYTADTLTIDCDNEYFRISGGTAWDGRTLYDLYKEAYTPWEWHAPLKAVAEECGIELFSTPFDETAVDFLEELGVPCHKVASFELIDIPLLRKIGATKKPVIMSTGMASEDEIREAVDTLRDTGCTDLTLLKCTSSYPADPADANLLTIPDMAERFNCKVGLSDHTLGIAVPVAAAALGARVIEKHFTLSRADGGPDCGFSLEPAEFKEMVDAVRVVEKAVGRVCYGETEADQKSRIYRRSLFAVEDIKAGEMFTRGNVRSIRPGHGLPPRELDGLLGQLAACDILRGTPLKQGIIKG
jgi:pseudaminic acid synthase